MSNKKENQTEKGFENVEVALTKSEQFVEKNQKTIVVVATAILALVLIIWGINTWLLAPQRAEAQSEIYNAQYYFEADSFALALNGDGMAPGFLDIIDEYGSTPAGNLAQYYAGVCYLNLGEFDNAKKYLKAYSSDDEILTTMAQGLVGDAEVELGNNEAAIAAYKKAIAGKNEITAPIFLMKLGELQATLNNAKEARASFEQVKTDYPTSIFADQAEKYMLSVK